MSGSTFTSSRYRSWKYRCTSPISSNFSRILHVDYDPMHDTYLYGCRWPSSGSGYSQRPSTSTGIERNNYSGTGYHWKHKNWNESANNTDLYSGSKYGREDYRNTNGSNYRYTSHRPTDYVQYESTYTPITNAYEQNYLEDTDSQYNGDLLDMHRSGRYGGSSSLLPKREKADAGYSGRNADIGTSKYDRSYMIDRTLDTTTTLRHDSSAYDSKSNDRSSHAYSFSGEMDTTRHKFDHNEITRNETATTKPERRENLLVSTTPYISAHTGSTTLPYQVESSRSSFPDSKTTTSSTGYGSVMSTQVRGKDGQIEDLINSISSRSTADYGTDTYSGSSDLSTELRRGKNKETGDYTKRPPVVDESKVSSRSSSELLREKDRETDSVVKSSAPSRFHDEYYIKADSGSLAVSNELLRQKDRKIEDLTKRLSDEMSTKLSRLETSLENVTIKSRPVNIVTDYENICSNEWHNAKCLLDDQCQKTMDQEDRIQVLKSVMTEAERSAKDIYNSLLKKIQHLISQPIVEMTVKCIEHADITPEHELPSNLNIQIGDTLRITAETADVAGLTKVIMDSITRTYKDKFTGLTETLKSLDFTKYVESCAQIAWKMVLQRPPMEFKEKGVDGNFADSEQDAFWGSSDPNDRMSLVKYYVHPSLYHGDILMKKGRVYLAKY